MTNDIVSPNSRHAGGTVHDLLKKHAIENPDQINAKRERFLALLRSRYGYSNDNAVDELERLLKSFYRLNRSLNIHLARPKFKMEDHSGRKDGSDTQEDEFLV